ncbi:MAG TPA: hypothetical protein VGL26_05270 [Jatrophihabitans sp.]|jgi:hypothetical protein
MATLKDVERIALSLPEVSEAAVGHHKARGWQVHDKGFVWERTWSKADIKRYGDEPVPDGVIIAIRTEDLEEKAAILAQDIPGFFTIPHFDKFAAYLIQLRLVKMAALREAITEAWLAQAPPKLAERFLSTRR